MDDEPYVVGVGDLPEALTGQLLAAGLAPEYVVGVVREALAEDLSGGAYDGHDITTEATVGRELIATATIVARAPGVVAGTMIAAVVFHVVARGRGRAVAVTALVEDGSRVREGEDVVRVHGSAVDLLTAERTALNLISSLSGTATLTRAWVDAVAGTDAVVRDTRKTIPGLRALQKYAVRCGGGVNHRMSLADAALVKDNHVVAAGGVAAAFALVRNAFPGVAVEVECDTVEQVEEAVAAGADLVLLDNMELHEMSRAVLLARRGGVRFEASGGLSLSRAVAAAATGVDFVAVGALTHSAPVLDLALDLALSGARSGRE